MIKLLTYKYENELIGKMQECDFLNLSNEDKFIYLMKNNYKEVASFISSAWNMREQNIYKDS